MRYSEICKVLNVLSTASDEKSRVKAVGYLEEVLSLKYITILSSMESILEIVHCTSNELQNCKLLLSSAIQWMNLNQAKFVKNAIWWSLGKNLQKIIKNSTCNGIEVNVTEKKQKRIKVLIKNLQGYFINTTP